MSCQLPHDILNTRIIRATIHGDYFNNKGSDGDITFRGKLSDSVGAETITAVLTVGARAARQNFVATFTVTRTGADTQTAFLAIANELDGNLFVSASFTVDEAEVGHDLVLDFTAQLDAADADFEVRRFSAQVEAI